MVSFSHKHNQNQACPENREKGVEMTLYETNYLKSPRFLKFPQDMISTIIDHVTTKLFFGTFMKVPAFHNC